MVSVKLAGPQVDKALLREDCNYCLTKDEKDRPQLLSTKLGLRWSMAPADEAGKGYAVSVVLSGDEGTYRRRRSFLNWTDATATALLEDPTQHPGIKVSRHLLHCVPESKPHGDHRCVPNTEVRIAS
jgi:hypothetical protein